MRGFAVILVVLAGCSGSHRIDAGLDAGRADAGVPRDAGMPRDAGADAGAAAPECTASGEPCVDDRDCCNELCDRPGGVAMGTCALLSGCGVAGEPCFPIGIGTCCSAVCLDDDEDGTPTCQRPSGCLQVDEPCERDAECCSGSCAMQGSTADGRPILRCENNSSCMPAGSSCYAGDPPNCCPNGDGDFGCTWGGEVRCVGGTPACTLPGAACAIDEECCRETFPSMACALDAWGERTCCLADGEPCSHAEVCCGGFCSPSDGSFRCRSTCIADGEACAAHADCCGCACADGACSSDPADCGPCTRGDLGERCGEAADCCAPLRCAIELVRPTCVLE